MRTGGSIALATLVVAACQVTASAAAGPPVLTMSGHRPGHVDVTVTREVSLDFERISMNARGSYAGIYIQPLSGPADEGTGFVLPTSFRSPGFDLHPLLLGRQEVDAEAEGERVTLRPGRHRFHLLADGPSTVSVGLDGIRARSLNLNPTSATTVVASVQDVTPTSPMPPFGLISSSVPHAMPDRAITVVALRQLWRDQGTGYSTAGNACLAPVAAPGICYVSPTSAFYGVENEEETSDGRYYYSTAAYYFPGDVDPGEHVAASSTVAVTSVDSVVGFAFSLQL